MSVDKWKVIDRNVAICDKCDGSMALWYNSSKELYCISCDYCDHEVTKTKRDVEIETFWRDKGDNEK